MLGFFQLFKNQMPRQEIVILFTSRWQACWAQTLGMLSERQIVNSILDHISKKNNK